MKILLNLKDTDQEGVPQADVDLTSMKKMKILKGVVGPGRVSTRARAVMVGAPSQRYQGVLITTRSTRKI